MRRFFAKTLGMRSQIRATRVYPRWIETIGDTPLVDISRTVTENPYVTVLGKCEFLNPSGSIKDRIVDYILNKAEMTGELKPGYTIVAASSGNTAAAVALFAAVKNYKAILITNKKCSQEKIDVLTAYGAQVFLTESGLSADDPDHYQNIESELCKGRKDFFSVNQYENHLNPEAYYHNLGPEILQQTNGNIDYFIAAASTGGTISGTSRYLKEHIKTVQCIMPDPKGSMFQPFWKDGKIIEPESFKVEGVGKDSIPSILDFGCIDDVPVFADEDAFETCHKLAKHEGLLVGGSAGGNAFIAGKIADSLPRNKRATIVCILCDSGIKYMTKIFSEQWLQENCKREMGIRNNIQNWNRAEFVL